MAAGKDFDGLLRVDCGQFGGFDVLHVSQVFPILVVLLVASNQPQGGVLTLRFLLSYTHCWLA